MKKMRSFVTRKPFATLSKRQQRRRCFINRTIKFKKKHANHNAKSPIINDSDINFSIQPNSSELENDRGTTCNDEFGQVYCLTNSDRPLSDNNCIETFNSDYGSQQDVDTTNNFIELNYGLVLNSSVQITRTDQTVESQNIPKSISSFTSFELGLAETFRKIRLKHWQQKELLAYLRKHKCHELLPKDPRTLQKTPRVLSVQVIKVPPGEYLHLGVGKSLEKILQRTESSLLPSSLSIDFNVDGCKLNKKYEITPIQIRISSIPQSGVEVAGFYLGRHKPLDSDTFMEPFIVEMNTLLEHGLQFNQKIYNVSIRSCSVDLPARAFLLKHKNHVSEKPCSKCEVVGVTIYKTSVYLGVDHKKRTDENYALVSDKKHQLGKSPLLKLGIKPVTQVPIDVMHCVYLGVHKKILLAWTKGCYGKSVKLNVENITKISRRIQLVAACCPREFARKPEILKYLADFKATQHRQFLLYFGISVINNIVNENVRIHYTLLCTAIRCLLLQHPNETHMSFATSALKAFILDAPIIYDLNFVSLNVHNLDHLVDDVKMYGPIDNYAAWPYENNMNFFRHFINKPAFPIQQYHNRLRERERDNVLPRVTKTDAYMRLFNPRNKGPYPTDLSSDIWRQWKAYDNLECKNFTIGTNRPDNTVLLHDNSIGIVENIFFITENLIHLLVSKFCLIEDLYDVGIESSAVGIYKCSLLSKSMQIIEHTFVAKKCYRLPYWKNRDEIDSTYSDTDTDDPVSNVYIVSILI